ncbi:MAG: tRNA epoxyqueuosine(34) reductase QueG [Acidobacteriota bacterium]
MSGITAAIKEKALELGFSKVGVAAAGRLDAEGERLDAWLGRGMHGQMAWMERDPEKRVDPRVIFPGTRSMIVVALNYFTPHEHEQKPAAGKISRYAWGDDYHDVLKGKLAELLEWIKSEIPEADGKICVDTAPVMDKAWAVRAGLGWQGKHSNVITKEFGSWVFLGEILLNLELDYDEPVDDHCGSCTACLEACPTHAIVAPYVVDSNACLSYATIELRTPELAGEISSNMNGWLYGCDICQDVCPWNRFEKPTHEARFEPRNSETSLGLDDVLEMSQEDFSARFRRSAIKRTKISGLQRNARHLKEVRD